jgi:pilus assembly protein CpaF
MFRLAVISPKGQQNEVECAIDACTIGKGDDNLIVIRGWSVGKKHATIKQRPEGLFVEDHGAMGGTEVNGKMIDGSYGPIKPDDAIVIGGYGIRVLGAPAASQATAHAAAAAAAAQPAPARSAPAAAAEAQPSQPAPQPKAPETAPRPTSKEAAEFNQARNQVHQKLIQAMDLRRLDVSHMGEK